MGIPPGARWTKIRRKLVNPEALIEEKERFEERQDFVIVLRVLSKEEIQRLADKTRQIRGKFSFRDVLESNEGVTDISQTRETIQSWRSAVNAGNVTRNDSAHVATKTSTKTIARMNSPRSHLACSKLVQQQCLHQPYLARLQLQFLELPVPRAMLQTLSGRIGIVGEIVTGIGSWSDGMIGKTESGTEIETGRGIGTETEIGATGATGTETATGIGIGLSLIHI